MISSLQATSRKKKLDLLYETFQFYRDTSILILGCGDGSNFIQDYPYKDMITAVDINESFLNVINEKYPEVITYKLDLNKPLPFRDDEYDFGYSNAVIEHLERQDIFASEVARICRRYFISTPNKLFPFEMHYRLPMFQFLPEKLQRIVAKLKLSNYKTGYFEKIRLLTSNDCKKLFKTEVRTLFMGYNLIIIKRT